MRIQRHATMAGDPANVPTVTRDRDDDYLVALARQENADAIVSVDLDLLEAGLTDPPIRRPRQLAATRQVARPEPRRPPSTTALLPEQEPVGARPSSSRRLVLVQLRRATGSERRARIVS
jgi:hypothetical protein